MVITVYRQRWESVFGCFVQVDQSLEKKKRIVDFSLSDMPQKDPCQKQACAIQKCLQGI